MITVEYPTYSLSIDGAAVGVRYDGAEIARLDVRCAVHGLDGECAPVRDEEPELPALVSDTACGAERRFVWRGKSSLWEEKTYTLEASPLRFVFRVSVRGHGRVDEIEYFSGNAAQNNYGSEYNFQRGFNPNRPWYNDQDYYFKASAACHRAPVLMVPPMYCYSFQPAGLTRQLSFGLYAKPGEHNFTAFDYRRSLDGWHSRFRFAVDFAGHTAVDGAWEAPYIVGAVAEDEFDAMRRYSEYYYVYGGAPIPKRPAPPKFWYGPIACGWIQQFAEHGFGCSGPAAARQDVYEDYVRRLHEAGLYPRCLIIDDKWQAEYGTDIADTKKWPDLRGFVDARHAEGIHTMLWFKTFDPEGIPEEAVVTEDSGARRVDVSHPAFLAVLDEALTRIFSPAEGCYDCDGIKIDYAFQMPMGRKFRTYSGKYGVELLYDFMKHIYDKAKAIKPEAIINCSPCHPYFASVCDQGRLHDYSQDNRDCREDLTLRAKLFSIAMPGVLLDTDNAGFNTGRDTMRWLLAQPLVGIPDLYNISPHPDGGFAFAPDELAALAQAWREYTDRIDLLP